jgi:hypothetical protein
MSKWFPSLDPFENVFLAVAAVCSLWLLLKSLGIGASFTTSGLSSNPYADGQQVRFLSSVTHSGHNADKYGGSSRTYDDDGNGSTTVSGMLGNSEPPVFWANAFVDAEDGVTQDDLMNQEGDGDNGAAWVTPSSVANPDGSVTTTDANGNVTTTAATTSGFTRRSGYAGKRRHRSGMATNPDPLAAAMAGANVSA